MEHAAFQFSMVFRGGRGVAANELILHMVLDSTSDENGGHQGWMGPSHSGIPAIGLRELVSRNQPRVAQNPRVGLRPSAAFVSVSIGLTIANWERKRARCTS